MAWSLWGLSTWRPKLPWEMGAGAIGYPAIPSGFVARDPPAPGEVAAETQVPKRKAEEVDPPDEAIVVPKRRRSGFAAQCCRRAHAAGCYQEVGGHPQVVG